jgi:ubiquinone/menaquinone biosynthesis C-methylase UbiE
MFVSARVLETESMETLEEVYAYDRLTMKYLKILHNGFVETAINQSRVAGKFLEVGSGSGRISIGIAKLNQQVELYGIDLSENMIKVARDNAVQEGVADRIEFSRGSATELPFADNSFDTVLCHNMLHHIPDVSRAVMEMKRVVKDDGAILIRDLIRQPPFIRLCHVHILGLTYNKLMKKEYGDSIKAALSAPEWQELFQNAAIPGARITKHFITHQGIEREAVNKRDDHVKVPTPFYLLPFKNMYVSSA